MAKCRTCGGGSASVGMSQNLSAPQGGDMVLISYTGLQTQKQRLKSRVNTSDSYVFSGNHRKFYVHLADLGWITNMQAFQRVDEAAPEVANLAKEETVRLESKMPEQPSYNPRIDFPLDALDMDVKDIGFFSKAGYTHVNMIRRASDAELLTNPGIGPSRIKKIRAAIDKL